MDAVSSRLDTAIKMQMVTKTMGSMVKGLDKVLQGMNPEAISRLMDQFEHQFESMDITSQAMEDAIGQTTALSTPEDEVNTLLAKVADENGLDMRHELDQKPLKAPLSAKASDTKDGETDELEAQFQALMRK
jgi:charged multivesicular body protein 1